MMSYWEDGASNISLNELCRRVGISKPSFYRAFGSEDGLMRAVIEQYRVVVVIPVLSQLASGRPFAEVLDGLLRWIVQPTGKPAGCLLASLRATPGRLGPEASSEVARLTDELNDGYRAWLEQGMERQEVDAGVPLDLATHFVDTQMNALLMQMALGADPELSLAQAQLAFSSLLATPRT